MRRNIANYIWGILLILAGALFLAQTLGYFDWLTTQAWVWICTGFSLAFLAAYFISGVGNWGWLFPALISGGIALSLTLMLGGVDGALIGVPILAGIGLPFLVAFLVDRRQNWWALIPVWVFAVLVVVTLLSERAPGELVGAVIMFSIALPFLVVYLTDRTRWWALIPAFVLAAVGAVILLSSTAAGDLIASFILFAIALPFFIVYFVSPDSWWAILPAGVLATIGLGLLLVEYLTPAGANAAVLNGIFFLGWAATFGVLWLRRSSQPTAWAKYPAIGLAIASLAAFALGSRSGLIGPIAIIIAGAIVLYFGLRGRRAA
jgi:hypothetical protein